MLKSGFNYLEIIKQTGAYQQRRQEENFYLGLWLENETFS